MRAEFTEDMERADTDGVSGRLRRERGMGLTFVQGLGFLLRDGRLVCVSPQAFRNGLEER